MGKEVDIHKTGYHPLIIKIFSAKEIIYMWPFIFSLRIQKSLSTYLFHRPCHLFLSHVPSKSLTTHQNHWSLHTDNVDPYLSLSFLPGKVNRCTAQSSAPWEAVPLPLSFRATLVLHYDSPREVWQNLHSTALSATDTWNTTTSGRS